MEIVAIVVVAFVVAVVLSRRSTPSPASLTSYRGVFPDGFADQTHRAVVMAKTKGIGSPREAMASHLGIPVPDDVWEKSKLHWETVWKEVGENVLTTR